MNHDQIASVYDFNRSVIGINREGDMGRLPHIEGDWLVCTLKEETSEYEDALKIDDPVESLTKQVDALIDLAFFALGGLIRLGVPEADARSAFNAVYAANMNKKAGPKDGRAVKFSLDAKKPEGWESPDELIRNIVRTNLYSTYEATK